MPEDNVEVQGGLPVTVGKSGALSPSGKIALDPTQTSEILKNMQAMIDQRTSPLSELSKGLERASAWGSGGIQGPSQALSVVNTQQDKQAQDLFNMRTQMAAYKAAQAQAENFKNRAAQQIGGGAPGKINAEAQMPPQIRQALQNAVSQNDQAGYDKIYNAWAQKQAEVYANPSMDEPKIPVVENVNGQWVRKTISARQLRENPSKYQETEGTQAAMSQVAPTGNAQQPMSVRQNNPGNLVDTRTGQIRTFATPQEGEAALDQDVGLKLSGQSPVVKERFGPQVGNFMSPALLAETWSPATGKGNSPESTANYAKAIASALGIAPTDQIPNTPQAKQAVKDAITKFEAGAYTPVTTASAPAAVAPTARPTPEQLEQSQKVEQRGSEEFASNVGKTNAAKAEQIDTSGLTAPERQIRYGDVLQIAEDPEMQKYLGMLAKKGVAPFLLKTLESGVNAGQFGTLGFADLEKNLVEAKAPKEVIEKLHRLQKHLSAAELEYAQVYLKGQGAVSDNERKLVKDTVGSLKDPAKVLKMQANVMVERAKFDEKVANLYNDYRATNGDYASFGSFMRSPAAQAAIKQHKTELGTILGRDTSSIIDPFKGNAPTTAGSESGKADISSFHTKKK